MRRAHATSAEQGFAPTRMVDEAVYLGHADPAMAFLQCGCPRAKLWRKKRKLWMRLLPFLKLYECEKCGLRVLRRPLPRPRAYPWALPRFYR